MYTYMCVHAYVYIYTSKCIYIYIVVHMHVYDNDMITNIFFIDDFEISNEELLSVFLRANNWRGLIGMYKCIYLSIHIWIRDYCI
jgi:hypothetical protein